MGRRSKKYIVIFEMPGGYIDCVGVYDNAEQAYGAAYLKLTDCLEEDEEYYMTLPIAREGENGYMIDVVNKKSGKVEQMATVLFYDYEEEQHGKST
jgi:hypothetical protein